MTQTFHNFYAELNRILLICYLKLPRNLFSMFSELRRFSLESFEDCLKFYQNYHEILLVFI